MPRRYLPKVHEFIVGGGPVIGDLPDDLLSEYTIEDERTGKAIMIGGEKYGSFGADPELYKLFPGDMGVSGGDSFLEQPSDIGIGDSSILQETVGGIDDVMNDSNSLLNNPLNNPVDNTSALPISGGNELGGYFSDELDGEITRKVECDECGRVISGSGCNCRTLMIDLAKSDVTVDVCPVYKDNSDNVSDNVSGVSLSDVVSNADLSSVSLNDVSLNDKIEGSGEDKNKDDYDISMLIGSEMEVMDTPALTGGFDISDLTTDIVGSNELINLPTLHDQNILDLI